MCIACRETLPLILFGRRFCLIQALPDPPARPRSAGGVFEGTITFARHHVRIDFPSLVLERDCFLEGSCNFFPPFPNFTAPAGVPGGSFFSFKKGGSWAVLPPQSPPPLSTFFRPPFLVIVFLTIAPLPQLEDCFPQPLKFKCAFLFRYHALWYRRCLWLRKRHPMRPLEIQLP